MLRKFKAHVYVTLRPSVLDPAGTAVQSGLKHMGYEVEQVRIGKYIELILTTDEDENTAREQLEQMCEQMLANTVVENYRFDLTEVAVEMGVSL